MKKITIVGNFNFNDEQKARLEALGEVKYLPHQTSAEEWSRVAQETDVICSDGFGLLDNLYNLKNVFVTYPYIELGYFDSKKLAANGVTIANTQGSNRDSIIEWVVFITLSLFRKFPTMLNVTADIPLEFNPSLSGKSVLIVGKGSIGTKIGSICESLGMVVDFFIRGDNLLDKASKADLIINCLNCNSTSKNLLDEKFFMSLKQGAYFISFVRLYTYDLDALIKSLDQNILAGAAIDCDPEKLGSVNNEFYQKILKHQKILATPHIASITEQSKKNAAEIIVKNVEAYISGKPLNIIIKK
ncbi:MAG: NAD(P)-dependent oxidoreductase [Patescibacteria group bacterium]|jgi:phosphoglycerate dehydrogenase-like enzyme